MAAAESAAGGCSCQNARRMRSVLMRSIVAATIVWPLAGSIAHGSASGGHGGAATPVALVNSAHGTQQQTQAKPPAAQKKTASPAEQLKALRQKAEKGDAESQYGLAVCYRTGKGVVQDDGEAVRWYRAAAEQGHAGAQNNLGWMYYGGKGVPPDDAEAAKWFRKAAELGDVDAQYNLGMMYRTARGVPHDDGEAVNWFRKAADQGDAGAQYGLGMMYEVGRGVPQDDVQAHMWLGLASARSSGERQKKYAAARDQVASRLTAAQIAEAKKNTQAWLDAFRKRKPTAPSKR